MQLSLRASLVSALIRARIRARLRSRARARAAVAVHQCADRAAASTSTCSTASRGSSARSASSPGRCEWNLPLPAEALQYAAALIPDAQPTLIISPCSSSRGAQLAAERYAARRRSCGAGARHARDPVRRPLGAGARDGRARSSAACGVPIVNQIGARHAAAAAGAAGARHACCCVRIPDRRTWPPWSARR